MRLSTGFLRAAISVLGVVSIVAMPGCGSKTTGSQETAVAPAVVVARVAQRTVPVYGEFVARTDGSATVDLVARVDGFLQSKSFEEGRFVQKGQVLYQIDPLRYQANVQSAKAQLAQAQAQLEKARKDVARCRPLAAAKAIPQQDLDAAIASEMVAQADVQAGQAAVMQAELDLSYCTIRAPFAGLIGKNNVSVGNLVGHGQATVLSTISAINPIKVIFGIPESGFLFLKRKKGKDISTELLMILSDNTPYPEKGRAIFVDRAVDIKTGTLEVQGEFPNPDGLLRPNQFGRIRLAIANAENALLIPQKAVMEQQSTKVVFVVGDDGKVVQRTVSLGPTSESFFIVSEGLKAGERVIVEGQQKARPGMVVTPTEQPLTQEPSSN